MKAHPTLSVIIPTYRRQHLVGDAVRSVLAESISALEVLVVDDDPERSAQPTIEAIDDDRVRYLTMSAWSGGRPARVRNWAMQQAAGDLLYFLDDDDAVVPGGLVALVDALEQNPRAGVAFGRMRPVGPDRAVLLDYMHYFERAARSARRVRRSSWLTAGVIMFRGTLIVNSVCIIRRDLALELQGYDTDLEVYEDVDFFTRGILRRGHVFVDWPVLYYATGAPSLIHDLGGDQTRVAASNRLAHLKFRRAHPVRYRALQVASKLIPLGS